MRKILKQILISLIIFLVLGEIGARILKQVWVKPPPYNTSVQDEYLGWKPKADYHYTGEMTDVNGEAYSLTLTTAYNGFRRFDGVGTDSVRSILVVGDSYTQAVEVSDDKTYYHYLAKGLQQPVNAFGMAGYGTLQEYLLLEPYLDTLKPEWLVLQVCTNDFINNHFELEWESYSNVGLMRPFWDRELEQVVRKAPLPGWKQVLGYSGFYSFVSERLNRLQMQQEGVETSESRIAAAGMEYEPFRESVATTESVLRMIRDRVPADTRLLVMPADGFQPQFDQLKGICKRLNIDWVEAPFAALHYAEGEGETIYSHDGYHWNETGHKIMGETLVEEMEERRGKKKDQIQDQGQDQVQTQDQP